MFNSLNNHIKMKILKTTKQILGVELKADGSLLITADGQMSISNAGAFINSLGGINAVLARCSGDDVTAEELRALVKEREEKKEEARRAAHKTQASLDARRNNQAVECFNELAATCGGVIPTNFENVVIVAKYLRATGTDRMPAMSVGYSANEYDCDGKIAIGIILDEEIAAPSGEMVSKIAVYAPKGHLSKYYHA